MKASVSQSLARLFCCVGKVAPLRKADEEECSTMSFVPLRMAGSLLRNRILHRGMQAAALILSASLDVAAQAPLIGPSDAIGMDYPEAWFVKDAIDRFEVQYDAEDWRSLGIPPVYTAMDGVTTYAVVPATPTGSHTVSFRACNAEACSTSTSPFAFVIPGEGTDGSWTDGPWTLGPWTLGPWTDGPCSRCPTAGSSHCQQVPGR